MSRTILLFDPTAPAASETLYASRKLERLAGSKIGFIDNSKPNFGYLIDDLATLLVERHGVAKIVKHAKRGPSMPAATEVIDDIASQCDLVITGSGD